MLNSDTVPPVAVVVTHTKLFADIAVLASECDVPVVVEFALPDVTSEVPAADLFELVRTLKVTYGVAVPRTTDST